MSHQPSRAACTVPSCERPVGDNAYVCRSCADGLSRDLADISSLVGDLDAAQARQVGRGIAAFGSRSAEKPLPYDPRVTPVRQLVHATLSRNAAMVWEERGEASAPLDGIRPDDTASVARWLMRHVEWLRHHADGATTVNDVEQAARRLRSVLEVNRETLYAGPCGAGDCPEELYVRPQAATVVCRACSTEHSVYERREWLRTAAMDHLGTAAEISALCRHMLGDLVTASMIRGYVHRGQLAAHGVVADQRGREVPTYRVGDVLTVAARAGGTPKARREARKAARLADAGTTCADGA